MTQVGPEVAVNAPAQQAPLQGLLYAAEVINDPADGHWIGGLTFSPPACGPAKVVDPCNAALISDTFADAVTTSSSTTLTSATAVFSAQDANRIISATADQTIADGVTNSTTTFTSATAAFVADDAGKAITATGIPASTTIASVTNGTTVVLSAAATTTATGVSFTIVARNVLPPSTTISSVTNPTTVVLSAAARRSGAGETIVITRRQLPANRPAKRTFNSFIVEAQDVCSTFGFEAADYEARARQALAAKESAAVEYEFWTGTLIPGNPHLGNTIALPSAVTVLANGVSPSVALGLLDQAIADAHIGRGMIHVRKLFLAAVAQFIRFDNTRKWISPGGNIIVAGDGYPGTGPNAEAVGPTEWAYATDMVDIYRGNVDLLGGPNANGVHRTTNEVTTIAERPYAYAFNGCLLAAVEWEWV